jgi:CRISPR-associated Csx10 family RAMP protein
MKRFAVLLRTEQDLLLGHRQTAGNYRASQESISGRTWRGAFAHALQATDLDRFRLLFDEREPDRQIRFGPLFPAIDEHAAPLPPTALTCKYHPGFTGSTKEAHGIFDTLVRQFAFKVVHEPGRAMPTWLDELRCPECDAPGEPYQGYRAEVSRRNTTHTAINRSRRVVEETQLYTREGVRTADYFAGWIDIPDDLLEHDMTEGDLKSLFRESGLLRIGANRSRGMGLSYVEDFRPYQPPDNINIRVARLNDVIRAVFNDYRDDTGEDYSQIADADANRYFTIDLREGAVIRERGLPTDWPNLSMLDAHIVAQWTEWTTIGGWHAAARLPRHTQPAVRGVYLARFNGVPNYSALEEFERDGIGEMREQGFGQITICDPIHDGDLR